MVSNKTMEEISCGVRKLMLENYLFGYDESDLENSSSFLQLGVLDSTGIMELVSLVERDYGIEVLDSEIVPENLDSVDCISCYIYKKLRNVEEG